MSKIISAPFRQHLMPKDSPQQRSGFAAFGSSTNIPVASLPGSIWVLARASVQELLPFISRTKALRLVSALRMGAVALREERQSLTIDHPLATVNKQHRSETFDLSCQRRVSSQSLGKALGRDCPPRIGDRIFCFLSTSTSSRTGMILLAKRRRFFFESASS